MHLSTLTQPSARVIARVVASKRRGSWLGERAVGAPRFLIDADVADGGTGVGRTHRGERVARQKVFVIPTFQLPGAST